MRKVLMIAFASAVVLGGCDQVGGHGQREDGAGNAAAPADAAGDAAAVRAADEQLLAAFQARDAAAAAALYTEDASVMIGNRPVVTGREAIRRMVEQDLQDPNFTISFTGADSVASGDLGYTRGTYTVTFTHPQTRARGSESGSYVTIFRRQPDGSWKVAVDITSPTAAAAPAAGEGSTEPPQGNSSTG
jgi:uncharacterized protein (TIGR02246 family)